MITFKILAALLSYPDQAMLDAVPNMARVLDEEKLLSAPERKALDVLFDEFNHQELIALEENYIALFDRGRSLSLHLFEHVHGESRERGQAMVDLNKLYAAYGLQLSANELPDYLPVFLEFLSQRSLHEAREMLGDVTHILRQIGDRLAGRNSAHHAVLGALLVLAGEKGLDAAPAQESERHTEDFAALDKEWEDAPVTFGADCAAPGRPQEAVIQIYKRSPLNS